MVSWRNWATDHEQLSRLRLLEKVALFDGLSRRQLGKLLVKLFEKHYEAGETIFSEGDPGKALFIVFRGKISIFHSGGEGETSIATLSPGAYFGELALIDDHPRFASARAEEPSLLLILYKSHFDELIEGHKMLAIKAMGNLLKTLATYVRSDHARGVKPAARATEPSPPEPEETFQARRRR
jgi:CRP-like cAMP-binding protein